MSDTRAALNPPLPRNQKYESLNRVAQSTVNIEQKHVPDSSCRSEVLGSQTGATSSIEGIRDLGGQLIGIVDRENPPVILAVSREQRMTVGCLMAQPVTK